jgi:5-methylcytosine-specific restriction endonuclease McrA
MDTEEFETLRDTLALRYPLRSRGDIAVLTEMVAKYMDRRRRRAERASRRHASSRNWMSGSRSARRKLYGRNEGHCAMCGAFVLFEEMTVGHIIPRSWGGEWSWGNVDLECEPCNRRKGAQIIPRRVAAGQRIPLPGPGRPAEGPYPLVHPLPPLLPVAPCALPRAPAVPRSPAGSSSRAVA